MVEKVSRKRRFGALGFPQWPQEQIRGEHKRPALFAFWQIGTQKAATGIRAQHTMTDGTSGLGTEWKSARAHQIDNLERGTPSATVKDEVNSDFDCCIALSTAR
jgi:hypothetical protein